MISTYTRGINISVPNHVIFLESTNCPKDVRDQIQAELVARLTALGDTVDLGEYVAQDSNYNDTNATDINVAAFRRWIKTAGTDQIADLKRLEATIQVVNGAAPTASTNPETEDVVKATNPDWDVNATGQFPSGETLANRAYRAISSSATNAVLGQAIDRGDIVVSLVANPSPTDPTHWRIIDVAEAGTFSDVFA